MEKEKISQEYLYIVSDVLNNLENLYNDYSCNYLIRRALGLLDIDCDMTNCKRLYDYIVVNENNYDVRNLCLYMATVNKMYIESKKLYLKYFGSIVLTEEFLEGIVSLMKKSSLEDCLFFYNNLNYSYLIKTLEIENTYNINSKLFYKLLNRLQNIKEAVYLIVIYPYLLHFYYIDNKYVSANIKNNILFFSDEMKDLIKVYYILSSYNDSLTAVLELIKNIANNVDENYDFYNEISSGNIEKITKCSLMYILLSNSKFKCLDLDILEYIKKNVNNIKQGFFYGNFNLLKSMFEYISTLGIDENIENILLENDNILCSFYMPFVNHFIIKNRKSIKYSDEINDYFSDMILIIECMDNVPKSFIKYVFLYLNLLNITRILNSIKSLDLNIFENSRLSLPEDNLYAYVKSIEYVCSINLIDISKINMIGDLYNKIMNIIYVFGLFNDFTKKEKFIRCFNEKKYLNICEVDKHKIELFNHVLCYVIHVFNSFICLNKFCFNVKKCDAEVFVADLVNVIKKAFNKVNKVYEKEIENNIEKIKKEVGLGIYNYTSRLDQEYSKLYKWYMLVIDYLYDILKKYGVSFIYDKDALYDILENIEKNIIK